MNDKFQNEGPLHVSKFSRYGYFVTPRFRYLEYLDRPACTRKGYVAAELKTIVLRIPAAEAHRQCSDRCMTLFWYCHILGVAAITLGVLLMQTKLEMGAFLFCLGCLLSGTGLLYGFDSGSHFKKMIVEFNLALQEQRAVDSKDAPNDCPPNT